MNQKEIFALCDCIRETGYAIHEYFGKGFLTGVYANALLHRLRKAGLNIIAKHKFSVHDEDGTVVGEHVADLLVEGTIMVNVVCASGGIDSGHAGVMLGYLKASKIEHGMVLNFGANKYEPKKLISSN